MLDVDEKITFVPKMEHSLPDEGKGMPESLSRIYLRRHTLVGLLR